MGKDVSRDRVFPRKFGTMPRDLANDGDKTAFSSNLHCPGIAEARVRQGKERSGQGVSRKPDVNQAAGCFSLNRERTWY